jgi:flagellar motor switch protein FliM
MIAGAQERRRPFNAELIRTRGTNLSHQLELLAPFSELLADMIGTTLSKLAGLPVKVTVTSTKADKLTALFQSDPGFDIVSPTATLCSWANFDRQFDNLMCEMCLGAPGETARNVDLERPATALEKRIRNLVFERLVQAVSHALRDLGDHADLVVQARPRATFRKSQEALQCYSLRLLLNVYDEACEFELFLGLAECVKLLGGEIDTPAPVRQSADQILEKAPFSVQVFLQPDTVDVRQILNLVPGEILKLNLAASAPVELQLNGQKISLGSLAFDREHFRVRVIGSDVLAISIDASKISDDAGARHGN